MSFTDDYKSKENQVKLNWNKINEKKSSQIINFFFCKVYVLYHCFYVTILLYQTVINREIYCLFLRT